MSRRIVTKSEWARMHEWHPSNVSYLLKRGIITERPDGSLDLRQVEAQLTEHTGRPTLFRSVSTRNSWKPESEKCNGRP